MKTSLWSSNTTAHFWRCETAISDSEWEAAIRKATPVLGLTVPPADTETLLALVLGEAQFGPDHWRLGLVKRLYYMLKPVLPRTVTKALRQLYRTPAEALCALHWPIEDRYPHFQWQVMRELLRLAGQPEIPFIHFWPEGHRFAVALTHDVERAEGQMFVRAVADLDSRYGFRSSFNFVPEGYVVDRRLMCELRERGFEIGVHGLKHDGRLFDSQTGFMRQARAINRYLKEWGAVGFRSPLMMRNPEWMQALEIEYDLSFFDTDPFEPIPGGTMSIWPFFVGRFVELPYTLVQDYTLVSILREQTPDLWLQKIDFIERFCGMALLNTHPDYLRNPRFWEIYEQFLRAMKIRGGYWQALPCEVAKWWRLRAQALSSEMIAGGVTGKSRLSDENVIIETQ